MKLEELAVRLGGDLRGGASREVRGVAALRDAGPNDLTFAVGDRALERAAGSRAGCILVEPGRNLPGHTTLAVANPKLALARAADLLMPRPAAPGGIHPSAVVAADAAVDAMASVGPHTVVERGAKIGPRTRLGAGVTVGEGAEIGADCVLYPRVTIYPGARIGDRVILHAGVVIGSDGFGYVFADGRHHKFPQAGKVIIENDVEIGSNSTVDRGSLGTTVIGEGTKIDNLVQIAHNVRLGRHCIIAAQTGISGSVEVGNYVVMGGQVGIADHIRIEDHVSIGGQAGLFPGKIVRQGTAVWGTPARPLAEYKKMYAHWAHLPALAAKVKELSRRISEREA
jgi:UDP-3-O-[3-hydroxymyristoyl] glucosamine N-acyltransferase